MTFILATSGLEAFASRPYRVHRRVSLLRKGGNPDVPMLMVPEKRLAIQAYEQVLDMIMGGQLKPGTLIQERRLAV